MDMTRTITFYAKSPYLEKAKVVLLIKAYICSIYNSIKWSMTVEPLLN